ncbi:MAG: response regulator transcription factor, partial [Barnesiella sp.]|nr:response regulator transcription factor [Barnesiella sp.]
PFAYERFKKAVEKVIRRIETEKVPENIVIKQEYANVTIPINDILYIEAMENYTKIFRENGGYILSRTNMKTIQEILPEENFLRIHRSYIVPIEKIEMFSKKKIKLIGKEIFLPIGRLYANHIYDTLISRNSGHIFPNP